MAIASKVVNYTPFNKTSWGFASTDLSGTHSGLTNVKVVITPQTSTQWDATGHISTVGSGAAVASYNKSQSEWTCSGPLADVDAVLVALNLFPADFPAIRTYDATTNPTGWTTTATKPNATNGTYANENPADTVPIPDTLFDLKVYDLSDGSLDATYVITFRANQPTFGKQRPYWSVAPTNEDAGAGLHDSVAGGLLNLGTVLQGSDTDPLTVICEFRHYNTSPADPYTGTAYGYFSSESDMFIGDKKPATRDNNENRLNFTGTKAEVQSYLDSVRYSRSGNKLAFDMVFNLSNGVVGSEVKKTVWYSDNRIGLTTVPGQSYVEDTAADWDFGALTTSSIPAEVDGFSATITVPTAAASNITSSTSSITQSYTAGTGVYLVSSSSESHLLTALRNITFTPETDYDADFDMTVQLTYTGSAISSSYTSVAQTVAVSGTGVEEMGNTSSDHTYVEDNAYSFISNPALPQIIHNTNSNFTITFTLGITTGRLEKTGTAATLTSVGNGVFTLAGTRDNVNADILTLKYIPAPDFNADHTISFSAIRTSGTGTPPTTTGSFTMTGTPVGEYSITQLIDQAWDEDVTQAFNSGLQITDTADEVVDGAAFGSHYIIACEMFNSVGGGAYTDGSLSVATASQGANLTISATNGQGGNGAFGGNALTISGTKTEVNIAMQNLEFTPNPNFEGAGPWVWYYIKRVTDNVYLTPLGAAGYSYPTEVISKFASASNTAEFKITKQTITWEENVTTQFDSGIAILDRVTENPKYTTAPNAFFGTEYKLETWMVDDIAYPASNFFDHGTLSTATPGSLVITGTGRGAEDLVMTGSKADLNAALATMKFIPDVDYFGAGPVVVYKITRLYDDPDFAIVSVGDAASTTFATNTASSNLTITPPSNISWNEDQIVPFNSGIVITDKATDNPDHPDWYLSDFEVKGRGKYWKLETAGSFVTGVLYFIASIGTTDFTLIGASSNTVGASFTATGAGTGTGTASGTAVLTEAIFNCTDNGGATVTGLGTDSSNLIITGTKAQVNTAVANLKMIGDLDMSSPTNQSSSSQPIWFEYQVKRLKSTSTIPAIVYNEFYQNATIFNVGTAIDPYHATVSNMAYDENTPTKIFEGKSVGITETATDDAEYPGNAVTYQVEVEISPNADGQWGTTGSSTYVTAVGTVSEVNAELQELVFTPTIDSAEDPIIKYKQTRYRSGDADLVQADGTVNIGPVTGTAVPSFVSTVTPTMSFQEKTIVSLFSGKTIGITEIVDPNITGVTYTVELECSPSTDAKFTSNDSNKIILNGTKDQVNAAIQLLEVTPIADTNIDFDIVYSQTRHIDGVNKLQADEVNIGTAVGVDLPEFRYGTANENIQYHVPEAHFNGVDVTQSEENILSEAANVQLTPRQLALNHGITYDRPITILDTTEAAQYKIIFSGGTLLTTVGATLNVMDTGWGTKDDIHAMLEDGIHVLGINDTNDNHPRHRTTQTVNFTLHLKAYTGTETQIANGQLTYKFLTGIEAVLFKPYKRLFRYQQDNGVGSPILFYNQPTHTGIATYPYWYQLQVLGGQAGFDAWQSSSTRVNRTEFGYGLSGYYGDGSYKIDNNTFVSMTTFIDYQESIMFFPSGMQTIEPYMHYDPTKRYDFKTLGYDYETQTVVPTPTVSQSENLNIRIGRILPAEDTVWSETIATPGYDNTADNPGRIQRWPTFEPFVSGNTTTFDIEGRFDFDKTQKAYDGTEIRFDSIYMDSDTNFEYQCHAKVWTDYGVLYELGKPDDSESVFEIVIAAHSQEGSDAFGTTIPQVLYIRPDPD